MGQSVFQLRFTSIQIDTIRSPAKKNPSPETMNIFTFRTPSFQRFIIFNLVLLLSSSLFAENDENTYNISDYLPVASDNYWSFIGEVTTDDLSSRVNIRKEVDSTVLLNNKKTYRTTQEVIPSLSDTLDQISFLNKKEFITSHNGWLVFREEYDGDVLQYNRPAKLLPLYLKLEESKKYKTSFDPEQGTPGVVSYHTVLVGLESLEIPNGTFEALKINQEKKTKIAGDEDLDNVSSLITEYNSYWLVKGIGIAKQETSITTISDTGSESIKLSYELVATDYLPNYLWPDAELTPKGWKHVNWFGDITDNYFPWIYHADHGWLFVDAEDTSDVKLWSENLGWWLTSEELYPTFYSLNLNDWLTYQENDAVLREFVRSDGSIVKTSTVGFTFRPSSGKPAATEISSQLGKEGDQRFVDSFGNNFTDSSGGIVADQGEAPIIELISPFEGTILDEGESLLLFVDAYDKDGKIEYVRFFINGKLVAIDELSPYQTIVSPPDDQDTLNVFATALDNYGNETQTNTVTVQVEISKFSPKVRIDSPLNKTVFRSGRRVDVEVVATDSDGFVESVAMLVDSIQVGAELYSPPYHFSFIPPVDGNYNISALAIDDDHNETTATSIGITVNETGKAPSQTSYSPEIRIANPLNKSQFTLGDTIEIEAVASDEDGVVERVQIFVDGVQVGSSLYHSPYKVNYTPQSTGNSTITAIARDDERTETTSTSVQITVN